MDKGPLISVLMSTYNEPKKYLKQSIETIMNQTYSKFEFIIVNDNPARVDLKEILKKYSDIDNRIVIIENSENIGLVESLNVALAAAKGDYIMRMDADDIASLDRIMTELDYIKRYDFDIVGTSVEFIDENGEFLYNGFPHIETNRIRKLIAIYNCVPHPTWMIKKSVYSTLGGYRNIPCCEDYDFLLRSMSAGYKIGMVPDILLKYRINMNGISKSNALPQFLMSRRLSDGVKSKIEVSVADLQKEYKEIKSKPEECIKYDKALGYIDIAVRKVHEKRFLTCVFYMVKAVTESRFSISYMKMRMKIKMAMR